MTLLWFGFFFFKQKTAYEMRISDWSSDVCSSDLGERRGAGVAGGLREGGSAGARADRYDDDRGSDRNGAGGRCRNNRPRDRASPLCKLGGQVDRGGGHVCDDHPRRAR